MRLKSLKVIYGRCKECGGKAEAIEAHLTDPLLEYGCHRKIAYRCYDCGRNKMAPMTVEEIIKKEEASFPMRPLLRQEQANLA